MIRQHYDIDIENDDWWVIDHCGYAVMPDKIDYIIERLLQYKTRLSEIVEFNKVIKLEKDKYMEEYYNSIHKIKTEKSERKIKDGYVYLVKLNNHYKIGIADNPESRLKEFTLLPYELETIIVEKVLDNYGLEKELHEKYKHKRIRGEWFELDLQDVEEVKTILRKQSTIDELKGSK